MNDFPAAFNRNYYRLPAWVRVLMAPVWIALALPVAALALIVLVILVCSFKWLDASEEDPVSIDDDLVVDL